MAGSRYRDIPVGFRKCKLGRHWRAEAEWRPGGHSCERCYRDASDKVRAWQKRQGETFKEKQRVAGRAYYARNREASLRYTRERPLEVQMLARAKRRAKEQGVEFSLTLADVSIPAVCPVFGLPLKRGTWGKEDGSPSLDRLIPTLGYVKGNVTVISDKANRIKNAGTAAEHERVAAWMRENGAL